MALKSHQHCMGDPLSSKQLNRSSKASLPPLYLAREQLIWKQTCAEAAWEGNRGFPTSTWASQVVSGKESTCQCSRRRGHGFDPWVEKIPWRRKQDATPVFLPGTFHGQRSLVGYSPWGHKESDTTEHAREVHRKRVQASPPSPKESLAGWELGTSGCTIPRGASRGI